MTPLPILPARARAPGSVTAIFIALSLTGCLDGPTAPTNAPPAVLAKSRSGSPAPHLVMLRQGASIDLAATIQQLGGTIERAYQGVAIYSVRGLTAQAVGRLAGLPEVEAVAQDRRISWAPGPELLGRRRPAAASNQSGAFFFPQFQWNLRVIRADAAWLATPQGQGALVCVLDSGIDPNHQDLVGKVDPTRSISFVPHEPTFVDFGFHGTVVAALISSNGLGVGSVAPDARLCAVKVFDANGFGTFEWVIAGIVHAADVGADVINMSFGAYVAKRDLHGNTDTKHLVRALQRAIDYARKKGVLSVASAGNDASNLKQLDLISIPSDLRQVISVGATAPVAQQDFDRVASYSNVGKHNIDVFAPGGDLVEGGLLEDLIVSACASTTRIFSDCATGTDWYIWLAGTSLAAPHVSGEAAVIESSFPGDQSADRLEHCILVSADRVTGVGRDPVYGKGRINVLGGAQCRRLP